MLYENSKCQHVKYKMVNRKYWLVYSPRKVSVPSLVGKPAKPNLPMTNDETQDYDTESAFISKMLRATNKLQTKYGVPPPPTNLIVDSLDLIQQ